MKFSVEWIKEYCNVDLTLDALVEKLTVAGLEVEGTEVVGDDVCVELEITANRPDCLSLIGIAREVAALTDGKLRLPKADYAETTPSADTFASVQVEAEALCPHYTARIVTGLTVGESPDWLKRRLTAVGVRPVNNVVDITNYVLLETGQPLHAFDLDMLDPKTIIVRNAKQGESMTLIDGKKQTLNSAMLVIADGKRPIAIAGVMGGVDTEVSASTTSVLLESGRFDLITTRRTARALKISTDSSYRFERGVDPAGVDRASRRACALLAELCGGKVAQGVLAVGPPPEAKPPITLRTEQVKRVLGIELSAKETAEHLQKIGFTATVGNKSLAVQVPTFRQDVTREVDLIEEVARMVGFDQILESEGIPIVVAPDSRDDRIARLIRERFIADGYHEAQSLSFVRPEWATPLSPWTESEPLTIVNPINKEENALRLGMLPSLLRARKVNQDAGQSDVQLFELGSAYLPDAKEKLPEQRELLAAISDVPFDRLKGTLEVMFERLGLLHAVRYRVSDWSAFEPGVAAQILLGGTPVGWIGQLTRQTTRTMGVKSKPSYLELRLAPLIEQAQDDKHFTPLPRFPAIDRQLSLVLDESVTWEQVSACIAQAAPTILAAVVYQGGYRGKQIATGKKAYLASLTFRATDRTLEGSDADDAVAALLAALTQSLGAELRA